MKKLYLLENMTTRSICPENLTGEKGKGGMCPLEEGNARRAARELGTGWKVNPYVIIKPGETFTLADIHGSGIIQHIWMTPTGRWRDAVLRMYWDDQENPSVECPVGDFFCMGWNEYAQLSSLAVCVNPGSAFNCYWDMPFCKRALITLTNLSDYDLTYYYQIDYNLCEVPENCAYFHAQFRRVNPLRYKDVYTIVDGIRGKGKYVGTYMAWGANNKGWWGEGEIKFYMDGDKEFPTICGTGTEDYFCGAFCFQDPRGDDYLTYTTPYAGFHQMVGDNRFGMYRWHVTDPVYFEEDLKVTMQALGWRNRTPGGYDEQLYLPLQDDIASVAFWYQTLPTAPFPPLPDRYYLEVI